ncbi:hypothetical protein CAOG_08565, partial [Capsaspora owczarzaki ATCC 30864]|uniref:hypothetical protein n=1 Tax=Capsaspora owczarzaki (strain ATCC 30864) TaxID=595528 RepID=UPI0003522D4E
MLALRPAAASATVAVARHCTTTALARLSNTRVSLPRPPSTSTGAAAATVPPCRAASTFLPAMASTAALPSTLCAPGAGSARRLTLPRPTSAVTAALVGLETRRNTMPARNFQQLATPRHGHNEEEFVGFFRKRGVQTAVGVTQVKAANCPFCGSAWSLHVNRISGAFSCTACLHDGLWDALVGFVGSTPGSRWGDLTATVARAPSSTATAAAAVTVTTIPNASSAQVRLAPQHLLARHASSAAQFRTTQNCATNLQALPTPALDALLAAAGCAALSRETLAKYGVGVMLVDNAKGVVSAPALVFPYTSHIVAKTVPTSADERASPRRPVRYDSELDSLAVEASPAVFRVSQPGRIATVAEEEALHAQAVAEQHRLHEQHLLPFQHDQIPQYFVRRVRMRTVKDVFLRSVEETLPRERLVRDAVPLPPKLFVAEASVAPADSQPIPSPAPSMAAAPPASGKRAMSTSAAAMIDMGGMDEAASGQAAATLPANPASHSFFTAPFVDSTGTVAAAVPHPANAQLSVVPSTEFIATATQLVANPEAVRPPFEHPGVFGWHTLGSSSHDHLVVTLNEVDAMFVHQETGLPTIALLPPMLDTPHSSAQAVTTLEGQVQAAVEHDDAARLVLPQDLLPHLEPFRTITLWIDSYLHTPSLVRFARRFGLDRVSVVKNPRGRRETFFHPHQAFDAGLSLRNIIHKARSFSVDRILTFDDLREDVFELSQNSAQARGIPFVNFPFLTSIVGGHRRGELTIFTGPTGAGKTTVLSQLSLELASLSNVPTLWGSFEIRNARLAQTMIRQTHNTDLAQVTRADFDDKSSFMSHIPMFWMNFFGQTEIDDVIDAIRQAEYAYNIEHVVLDNLQFMLDISSKSGFDKFTIQDQAISKLRKLSTDLNIHITLVMHPRKDDASSPNLGSVLHTASISGTGKATQEADNVWALQKFDKFADAPGGTLRAIDILKNRFSGQTGLVFYTFNSKTQYVVERAAAQQSMYSER